MALEEPTSCDRWSWRRTRRTMAPMRREQPHHSPEWRDASCGGESCDLRQDRQDLEQAHRRVLEMDADLVREPFEPCPHRGAGHLDGRRARSVLDRRLE